MCSPYLAASDKTTIPHSSVTGVSLQRDGWAASGALEDLAAVGEHARGVAVGRHVLDSAVAEEHLLASVGEVRLGLRVAELVDLHAVSARGVQRVRGAIEVDHGTVGMGLLPVAVGKIGAVGGGARGEMRDGRIQVVAGGRRFVIWSVVP